LGKQEIDRLWEEGSPIIGQIYAQGADRYLSGIQGLDEAFKPKDRTVRCIDEGTPGGISCAGSGILLGVDAAAEVFRRAEVDGVHSHEGCGAARIYAEKSGFDLTNPDIYGIEFAKRVADALKVPYKGHIASAEMARPKNFHPARVTFYDGIGAFDPSRVKGLPTSFTVDGRYHEPHQAIEQARLSVKIALGSHGFGERFTPEEPFVLIAVRDGLKEELKPLAKEFKGRVIIDSFNP